MMPTASAKPPAVELEDFDWLASDEASRWMEKIAQSEMPLHALAAKLRRELSGTRSHLLLEQSELRRRGAEKFSQAARMLFTARGLEQATDEWIGRYKAQRFRNQTLVADLCCGIGGDLIGLLGATGVSGVDRCAVAAYCAGHNAAVHQADAGNTATMRTVEVQAVDVAPFTAWHIDPDRRPQGRRTTRMELHEPNRAAIEQMLTHQPNAAIKLAPASNLPADQKWAAEAEFEWISRGGQCRQLVAWRGELAHDVGKRRATVVGKASAASFVGCPETPAPVAESAERYIFEPDAAVLAARMTAALASRHGLHAVSPGVAYLTGPQQVTDPLLACFEIHDCLPFDRRKLAAYLRQRNVGRVEIKHRWPTIDPDRLRAELKLRGDAEAVLVVTKLHRRTAVLVAQRVTGQGGDLTPLGLYAEASRVARGATVHHSGPPPPQRGRGNTAATPPQTTCHAPRMKLAFSSNAYLRYSVDEAIRRIAEIGYSGIEILADVPHAWPAGLLPESIDAIRRSLERHGLTISNVNAFMMNAVADPRQPYWYPSWIDPDPHYRAIRREHTKRALKLAKEIGAPHITTEPGGPLAPGQSRENASDIFYEELMPCVEVAETLSMPILIEPEPELLIEKFGQYLEFAERVDSPLVKLNFDVGHAYCVGEDPQDWVARLAAHTMHYHFEDIATTRVHQHLIPGRGAIDFAATMREIRATGYDGWLTVELYPYLDDPDGAAREALEFMRKL